MTAPGTDTLHETHKALPPPPASSRAPDREQKDKPGIDESLDGLPHYPSPNGSVPVSER